MWRFSTVLTHGDLAAEQVLVEGGAVETVLGWSAAAVADPAADLAWLIAALPDDVTDTIIETYALRSEERRVGKECRYRRKPGKEKARTVTSRTGTGTW